MKSGPKDCPDKNRWLKFFRKWHRWPGVIMAFFFILWAVSGIVMNHRALFSSLDIDRKFVPKENRYVNWNIAAVKSALQIGSDSILFYGNIGIWLSDSALSSFTDFNSGFPKGIDNRKISSMLKTNKGNVYAGTLFGLFFLDKNVNKWKKLDLPVRDSRIQWLVEKEGKIIVLTRSFLLEANDDPYQFITEKRVLPPPENYDNSAGLFRTIWVIHSGEIYGMAGKLIVDFLGIVVILLAITGSLHFAMPYALRYLKRRNKPIKATSQTKKVSANWHKKAGIWIALFLLINTVTGMFLRPPLLISIANARVGKIPWSVLDTPNSWDDKLRAVIWDDEINGFIIGTTEGLFFARKDLKKNMIPLPGQAPLSVMGINVFQKTGSATYLVGTFNGLYEWKPEEGKSMNYISRELPGRINSRSKPFGENMISGYWKGSPEKEFIFDYNRGAISLNNYPGFPLMPAEIIEKSPISWWNFALEVHTGRIFKPFTGNLYILIIPIFGIFGTILVITGIIIWIKLYVRKHR